MDVASRNKIIKLLNLTRSNNDNEALLAIRRANEILTKYNYDWNKFNGVSFSTHAEEPAYKHQSAKTHTSYDYEESARKYRKEYSFESISRIDDMELINWILEWAKTCPQFNNRFVREMRDVCTQYGTVTSGQRQALEKIAIKWRIFERRGTA